VPLLFLLFPLLAGIGEITLSVDGPFSIRSRDRSRLPVSLSLTFRGAFLMRSLFRRNQLISSDLQLKGLRCTKLRKWGPFLSCFYIASFVRLRENYRVSFFFFRLGLEFQNFFRIRVSKSKLISTSCERTLSRRNLR